LAEKWSRLSFFPQVEDGKASADNSCVTERLSIFNDMEAVGGGKKEN
jgi:hypothetical protein